MKAEDAYVTVYLTRAELEELVQGAMQRAVGQYMTDLLRLLIGVEESPLTPATDTPIIRGHDEGRTE